MTATVALSGTFMSMSVASWQAFITELVPREDLLNAVILNSTQFNAARAIGPAVGGVVLGTLGPGGAFMLNALSFVVVIVALVMVRVRRPPAETSERTGILREFASTLRYVRRRRGIVACCVLIDAVGLCGSPIFSLVVVFAEDVFHVSRGWYGVLSACLGAGAVLGAPLVAGRAPSFARSRVVGAATLTYALAIASFGAAPAYVFGAISLLVAGASYLAIASTTNTTVQLQVDENMRGRVLAFYLMTFTAAIPLGSLIQGWTAETVGPRPTVITAGLLLAVVVVVLRARGLLGAMDREYSLPVVDGREVIPTGVALLEDGAPAAGRPGLVDGIDASRTECEPLADRVDDASSR
jgi:predicted MFS family arabinose efflux permease